MITGIFNGVRQGAADFVLQHAMLGPFCENGMVPAGGLMALQHEGGIYFGAAQHEIPFDKVRILVEGPFGFSQVLNGRYHGQTRLVPEDNGRVRRLYPFAFAPKLMVNGKVWLRPDPLDVRSHGTIGMMELVLKDEFAPGSIKPVVLGGAFLAGLATILETR